MKLTSKQKAKIRKEAQTIKPLFQIGAQEVHTNFIEALRESFNNKEIIKIKINRADKTDHKITKEIAGQLAKKIKGAEVAGVVGTTIILFKRNKDKKYQLEV